MHIPFSASSFTWYGHLSHAGSIPKGQLPTGLFLCARFMCTGSSGSPWAIIVFVKTSHIIHGVLMPVFEQAEQAATFLGFLQNENTSIQVAVCRFEQNRWEVSKEIMPLIWPKSGTLYP
jgi:hypothetical protein